jgi:cholesterol transport system auxiliary component
MKYLFCLTAVVLLFSGCSVIRPATHEYTILPTYTPTVETANALKATLKLSSTRTIPSLSSTQFFYLKETSHIDAYLYSRWSDTPSSMIDRALYTSMQNQKLFETLIPSASSATADLILESDLNAFYQRFLDNGTSEGLIDITYRLINPKNKKTIASKRFILTQPSPSADAKGGVAALDTATHNLTTQCILWLNLTLKESQWIK